MAASTPKRVLPATPELEPSSSLCDSSFTSPATPTEPTTSRRLLTPRLVASPHIAYHVRIKTEQPSPLELCDAYPFAPSQGWLFPSLHSALLSATTKVDAFTETDIRFADSRIPEFKSNSKTQSVKTLPIRALVSPAVPRTTGVVTRSMAKASVSTKTQSSDKPNRPLTTAPASSIAKASPVAGPVFKPFCPRVHLKKSTSTLIREILLKPLTKTELETVYLYVYWYPGNFGKVKIGSTKNVKNRFLQWQKQCKHPIQNCVDRDLSLKSPAVHARRLEKLIHAELKDYRMEEQRCICKEKHNEWFETTEQHVKQVIQKWTNWITSKKRYENVVGGRLIKQSTKEKEILQLCQPILRPDDFVYTPEIRAKSKSEATRLSTTRPPLRRSARLRAKALDSDAMLDRNEETTSRKKRYSQVPRDKDDVTLSIESLRLLYGLAQKSRAASPGTAAMPELCSCLPRKVHKSPANIESWPNLSFSRRVRLYCPNRVMPITPLPADARRSFSSSLVLNDAASVVKELIDNALDAHASTVSIEISSNTLDVIQVRDNGAGVDIEDRPLLCKHGCTSKIRTIEDLSVLGGTFLGFRGEALASLTQLGGSVTITTRIDGEIVGSALKYGREGNLLSSTPVSHPVGTTVRIQDFLSNIPVRKGLATKAVPKTLNSLGKLLCSYALARPQTRFALKVLKSKDGKMNYSFAPCPITASLSEVAAKVVGRDVSSLCTELVGCTFDNDCPAQRFRLQALLLDPLSDLYQAPGADQYFSIDGRPLSAERGIMRDFSRLYKKYLRSASEQSRAKSFPSRPFLYVKITCPPDSYDVNVEPAKDEVLFLKPEGLTSEFEQLLTRVYGKLGLDRDVIESATAKTANQRDETSFDLLMARKYPKDDQGSNMTESYDPICTRSDSSHAASLPSRRHKSSNMHVANDDYPGQLESQPRRSEVESADMTGVSTSNPWTMAKMNVVLPPKKVGSRHGVGTVAGVENDLTPHVSEKRVLNLTNGQLPSPVTSPTRPYVPFQNPVPSPQVMSRRGLRQEESEDTFAVSSDTPVAQKPSLPDMWVEELQNGSQITPSELENNQPITLPGSQAWATGQHSFRHRRVFLPPNISEGCGKLSDKTQQERLVEPHRTSFKYPTKNLSQNRIGQAKDCLASTIENTPDLESTLPVQRPMLFDATLATTNRREPTEILDFEKRDTLAMAVQRKPVVQSREREPLLVQTNAFPPARSIMNQEHPSSVERKRVMEYQEDFDTLVGKDKAARIYFPQLPTNNPYENRYLGVLQNKANARTGDQHNLFTKLTEDDNPQKIPESDPRGYLIHHNRTQQSQEEADQDCSKRTRPVFRRMRTTRLPLEVIPAGLATCQLVTMLNSLPDVEKMKSQATKMTKVDEYPTPGETSALTWEADASDVELWQYTLYHLMKEKLSDLTKSAKGEGALFDFDLKKTILCHVAASSFLKPSTSKS